MSILESAYQIIFNDILYIIWRSGFIKATTNNWDIRPSVTVKVLLPDISWTAGWIFTIELALESAHQYISDNIWYI